MAQAGGGRLIPIPQPSSTAPRPSGRRSTRGLGGALAWPALLRKLDRLDPGYRA